MFLNPKAPLFFGIVGVLIVVGSMVSVAPTPARLSSTHADVAALAGPENCQACHTETGLTDGCLSCHQEIRQQFGDEGGYHSFLLEGQTITCTPCHVEHYGTGFPLVSERSWGAQVEAAFRHPHVDFVLEGKHETIDCRACHQEVLEPKFVVRTAKGDHAPLRFHTYLGLDQTCSECHTDPHANGAANCRDCHGQESFGPPVFDHGEHLPLAHGHADLDCRRCHEISAPRSERTEFPYPFEQTKGNTCSTCHETPHRTDFGEDCSACHPVGPDHWQGALASMTIERHEQTGFSLHGAHETVDCSKCHTPHQPYGERHPDPAAPGYQRHRDTCEGCHEDVHRGQFEGRYDGCIACHQTHDFEPTRFSHAMHAEVFALRGAHAGVDCESCHRDVSSHGARIFAGTSHACRDCHEDPHAGQFAEEVRSGDCTACHTMGAETFQVARFDHAKRTGYPLTGAHAFQDCSACHVETTVTLPNGELQLARLFRGTSTACSSCHEDEHRGQFEAYAGCDDCHVSTSRWNVIRFDHNRQSRFQLTGAHALIDCRHCHPSESVPGTDETMLRFRPLQLECRQCHEL